MKSTEVYSIARQVLAPWCKEHGFKRTKGGMLGWYKPIGDQFIVFWFQVSQSGWDEDIGSQFTVEFQVSDEPTIGAAERARRWRLPKFLDEGELERVGRMQSDVIAKLWRLDRSHPDLRHANKVVRWLRGKSYKYAPSSDLWLRYKDREDVERWASFVKEKLPGVVRLLSRAPANSASQPTPR